MKHQNNAAKFFAGKGYYIALILCAVAIGVTGYLYYRNIGSNTDANNPGDNINVMNPSGNVGILQTKPIVTDPTVGTVLDATKPKHFRTGAPVEGETVMDYCMDCLGYNPTTRDWRTHDGMDIAAESGTPVCAAADGTVYTIYTDDMMGNTIVIRHENGYVTTYASLGDQITVKAGDTVQMGQTIGHVGDSALLECAIGDHVHFSVTQNGETIDPEVFLNLG